MVTKKDLQAELDELGIEWDAGEVKADLLDKLADYQESLATAEEIDGSGYARSVAVTDDADTGTGTAESFEDVTGLCRQCGKPADHTHIGV